MDHKLIRSNARYVLKNNFLKIWLAHLIVELISLPFLMMAYYVTENGSLAESIIVVIALLLLLPLNMGLYKYYLDLVRGKIATYKSLFSYFGSFGTILLTIIILNLIVGIGSILIIPGIIFSLMYVQVFYIIVDDEELNAFQSLKKSRELMKGYKLDYVIFNLKFIGWILLAIFTGGIASVFVIPYLIIAQTKYYDNLIELNKN